MRGFGQPKRETACACERSSDPTLDQALNLLNGQQTLSASVDGAKKYARLDAAAIGDELYLSAYAPARRRGTGQDRRVRPGISQSERSDPRSALDGFQHARILVPTLRPFPLLAMRIVYFVVACWAWITPGAVPADISFVREVARRS